MPLKNPNIQEMDMYRSHEFQEYEPGFSEMSPRSFLDSRLFHDETHQYGESAQLPTTHHLDLPASTTSRDMDAIEPFADLEPDEIACNDENGHQRIIRVNINKKVAREFIVDPFHPFDSDEISAVKPNGEPVDEPSELDTATRKKVESAALSVAKNICASCLSINECSEWAIKYAQNESGIYGGMTKKDRNRLRTRTSR